MSSTPLRAAAVGLAVTVFAAACARVPYTGRQQFNAIPDSTMDELGDEAYREILAQSDVVTSGADVQRLRRVGTAIASAANQPDFDWQFALIRDDAVNAWCLPGGRIGVYTGILPVFENEAGMAFVLGHEVGHAMAEHSAERMSQQLGLSGALSVIEGFLTGGTGLGGQSVGLIMGALGVGAQVGVLLPYSRTHEQEADVIGLMLMAEAGYPPAEALQVWNRMERAAGGAGQPPVFLSTHPSYDQRREVITQWLPEARKRYARNIRDREDVLLAIW